MLHLAAEAAHDGRHDIQLGAGDVVARRALSDPTQSINRIAQQLGYADNSSFFRTVKKWTRLSPKSFRERLLG